MRNYIDDTIKNTVGQIKYRESITLGEIKIDNGDGTYGVEISQSGKTYPNIETAHYGDTFAIGEIAIITYEYGNKEMPRIWGHAKKIAQEPKQVEVDYSSGGGTGGTGGTGGGEQTETVTIFSEETNKSYIENNGAGYTTDKTIYNNIHNAALGNSLLDSGGIKIGQYYSYDATPEHEYGTYYIYRGYLLFDTSLIPASAIISSVILKLFFVQKTTDFSYNIVIQDGQPNYPHNPLILSDYYYNNYNNNGGQISTNEINLGQYSNIDLSVNGINWINKGGITKFCLRSSRDIASQIVFIDGEYSEYAICYANVATPTPSPKLVITYTI